MLPADLSTLSQERQVELEKVQGLVMAMEEPGPVEKVLSGVRVCSAECADLDSLLFCTKQELVARKQSDWSSFHPEYNWGHWPSWHRLSQKQKWIQKGLWEIVRRAVHGGNQNQQGSGCNLLLKLLLNSWFARSLGVWPRVMSSLSPCKSQDTGLWMDLCSDSCSGSNTWSLPGSKSQWHKLKFKCQHLSGMWHLFGLSWLVKFFFYILSYTPYYCSCSKPVTPC